MGGFFGVASKNDAVLDTFFGVDYHSHLGTRRAGMAAMDAELGMQRKIHKIENSPFRTKFERILDEMEGKTAVGCISDSDAQPLLIRSNHGLYAICTIGIINNSDALVNQYLSFSGGHFGAMTTTGVTGINASELVAAMIDQKSDFAEGIRFAQDVIDGTASILILKEDGNIIAARDKVGRIPVLVGKREDGYCVSFEDFAYKKLGYEDYKELGPGEIVEISSDGVEVLSAPRKKKKICAFLWSYYGYPTSCYEGVNVEIMRYRNGQIMARRDKELGIAQDIDYVSGVPDSGTPHAIGYSNESSVPFARPFIKYTLTWPRSFMPSNQKERSKVAKMKQIPVHDLIKDKKLLFVDDSIVRGTQLRETVEFLYENGAKEVHMRSACPPIMYGCKYLNFSRSKSELELITRRVIADKEGENAVNTLAEYADPNSERYAYMLEEIRKKQNFTSLRYHRLDDLIASIGLKPCELCTYCFDGRE